MTQPEHSDSTPESGPQSTEKVANRGPILWPAADPEGWDSAKPIDWEPPGRYRS